CLRGYSPPYSF
nr:immunoglobulin light chain junction region [Macaca mulatta]